MRQAKSSAEDLNALFIHTKPLPSAGALVLLEFCNSHGRLLECADRCLDNLANALWLAIFQAVY